MANYEELEQAQLLYDEAARACDDWSAHLIATAINLASLRIADELDSIRSRLDLLIDK